MPSNEIIVAAIMLAIVINVFFCLTLRRTLMQIRPANRQLELTSVWVLLIPIVNLFWNFIVVSRMSGSLKDEFIDRDFELKEKPGYAIGMAYAAFNCFANIPVKSLVMLTGVSAIAGVIFFVQYWIKINWYRKVLESDSTESPTISG